MSEDFLHHRLKSREEQDLLRKLSPENNLVDFSSNDYLGFARSEELQKFITAELQTPNSKLRTGSTGSRLLTGNSQYAEDLEKFIAEYHKAEAGLIFNSGYNANLGLISSVAQKGDVIFYDELSHASIYDGVRLSKAESFPFRHNDISHLEERLKFYRSNHDSNSNCFVIVESVYSMDGDFSPLKEITSLCEEYNANLIVDEAHATGIFGPKGEGRVVELNLHEKFFARVHTFGKALGCHGAIVLGSEYLRNYLINYARSFIYTTALPVHSLVVIKSSYNYLLNSYDRMLKTNDLIKSFKSLVKDKSVTGFLESSSPIQSLVVEGNEEVKRISLLVRKDGFDVRPILSPTVPKGKERIRICLHTFNTLEEIKGLLSSLKKNSNLAVVKQELISE
ncbi:MAG: pyridoxal phosphate-dependent aminotransferase family protein [Bacteroidetes bacterium]|nr:pyridoxal phosphate-dependent aminotransferase family protein [Bacteroidota bacterium]